MKESKEDIRKSIINFIVELSDDSSLKAEDIDANSSIEDLTKIGFDSLSIYQLLCEVDDAYGIKISDEKAATIKDINDVVSITISEMGKTN